MNRVRIISIYRGRLAENRGTPIRVRSLLERLAQDSRFELTVASWDTALPFEAKRHIHLTNRKYDDARALIGAARGGAQIIMGHTMATWYYLLMLKVVARAKIVLEMHGFIEVEARFYGSIGLVRYLLERCVYRIFYPICDIITTCSDNAAEILRRANRNTIAIYGGVDTELFRPSVVPGSFFVRREGDIILGYAGNLRKWQGVPFLIEAFRRLRETDSRFRLVILSSESRGLPEGEGIEVIKGISHELVPSFLAACDVLVIPRIEDAVSRISFPSKLPEYLAMGKSVVASATSDMHRVITDGTDGFVFPPGDVNACVAILRRLADPDIRARIGAAARATAVNRFSWEQQGATLAQLLLGIT